MCNIVEHYHVISTKGVSFTGNNHVLVLVWFLYDEKVYMTAEESG